MATRSEIQHAIEEAMARGATAGELLRIETEYRTAARTTFRPIAEPAYGIMKQVHFLVALDQWAQRPRSEFSMFAPPVDAFGDGIDEDYELASTFYRTSRRVTTEQRMLVIEADILFHNRQYEVAWNSQKGSRDPRKVADRSGWIALTPYKNMIGVLQDWHGALRQRLVEETP